MLQALLRGEQAEWEGKPIAMMHPAGFGATRPIEVPFVLAVGGPRGMAAARKLGAGVIFAGAPAPEGRELPQSVVIQNGTILQDGEDAGDERVIDAAGHVAGVVLHSLYERGQSLDGLPGGAEWAARTDALPANDRHIALHQEHLVGVNERDRSTVAGALIRRVGAARTPDEWRSRFAKLEAAGVTEVAYQPAGSDIVGELRRFADIAIG